MIAGLVILGIFGYVFLARVFFNLMFEQKEVKTILGPNNRLYIRTTGNEICNTEAELTTAFFPITLVALLIAQIFKLPLKLADIVTNPKNYKFKIKFERKEK